MVTGFELTTVEAGYRMTLPQFAFASNTLFSLSPFRRVSFLLPLWAPTISEVLSNFKDVFADFSCVKSLTQPPNRFLQLRPARSPMFHVLSIWRWYRCRMRLMCHAWAHVAFVSSIE
jgi:hypothetical protein